MSHFCPLVSDLQTQAPQLRRFILKAVLLLALFLVVDHLLGAFLRAGLDRYYGLDQPAQVLCVGHSRTALGIDKVALEQRIGVPVAKFAVAGANTADRLEMIRYYFRRQPSSVRAVVYDVDAHTFTSAGLSSASYSLLYPFIDDPGIRAYIQQQCASVTEYWLRRILHITRYNELTLSLAARGYLRKWDNLKFGQVNVTRLQETVRQGRFRRIGFDQDNIKQFQETADFVSGQGCTLFLASIPTIDVLNHGEPEKFASTMAMFHEISAANGSVVFLDYNPELQGRHELFFDAIHLNPRGQALVTQRLGRDLALWLKTGQLGVAHADAPAAESQSRETAAPHDVP